MPEFQVTYRVVRKLQAGHPRRYYNGFPMSSSRKDGLDNPRDCVDTLIDAREGQLHAPELLEHARLRLWAVALWGANSKDTWGPL